MIQLTHCSVEWTPHGSRMTFKDGVRLESWPHDVPHYHVNAHRLGYNGDLLAYCRDHDFFHAFCEQWFYDRPSPTLWAVAHNKPVPDATYEEMAVMTCQRWVRANERPIIGDVDWDAFKTEALSWLKT
jgi:hypothetical protein